MLPVLMQSAALRASALENHIAWLLRSKCELISNEEGFVLKDEPQPATREKIRKSHVKSVSIGKPFMTEASRSVTKDKGNLELTTNVKKFQPDGAFMTLIKDLLNDDDKFEKLGLDNNLFDGNLEVWIEIRYPKRSRSQKNNAIKLLDDIGIALRDLDDGDAMLKLNDGSIVKGKDLRISSDIGVVIDEKGLPNESELFTAMAGWLMQQIKDEVIDPD